MGTNVTIGFETEVSLAYANLHHAGGALVHDLALNKPNEIEDLPDGGYYVSIGGTGENPGKVVDVIFAGPENKKTRQAIVLADGTIYDLVPFGLTKGRVR